MKEKGGDERSNQEKRRKDKETNNILLEKEEGKEKTKGDDWNADYWRRWMGGGGEDYSPDQEIIEWQCNYSTNVSLDSFSRPLESHVHPVLEIDRLCISDLIQLAQKFRHNPDQSILLKHKLYTKIVLHNYQHIRSLSTAVSNVPDFLNLMNRRPNKSYQCESTSNGTQSLGPTGFLASTNLFRKRAQTDKFPPLFNLSSKHFLDSKSLGNMAIGICRRQASLTEFDLLIDDSAGVLRVLDLESKLNLSNIPVASGYLYKKKSKSCFPGILSWNRRYVVVENCSIMWFSSKKASLIGGISAASGCINFILTACCLNFGTSMSQFQLKTELSGKGFLFDSRLTSRDRGKWMVDLLIHINKAKEIRSRFKNVAWDSMEKDVLRRNLGAIQKTHLPHSSCASSSLPQRTSRTSKISQGSQTLQIPSPSTSSSFTRKVDDFDVITSCFQKARLSNKETTKCSQFSINQAVLSKSQSGRGGNKEGKRRRVKEFESTYRLSDFGDEGKVGLFWKNSIRHFKGKGNENLLEYC